MDAKTYAAGVERQGDRAEAAVRRALSSYFRMTPNTSVAGARNFAAAAVVSAGRLYGAAAGHLALTLRNEQASQAGVTPEEAAPFVYEPDYSKVLANAHFEAGKLAGGDRQAFIEQMGNTARYYAERGANETMVEASPDKARGRRRAKYALVPSGSAPCILCLQRAGHGFNYNSARTAEAARPHKHCHCMVVPGYGDSPSFSGYDPEKCRRLYNRITEAAKTERQLYSVSTGQVIDEAEQIEKTLRSAWNGNPGISSDSRVYRDVYGRVLAEQSPRITADDFTKLYGKELQVAKWFADTGSDVHFRNPDGQSNTSDLLLNGKPYELKRIESGKPGKLAKRVTEKLDRQGPNFIVDLSVSSMECSVAEHKVAELLDDDAINEILLVFGGTVKTFMK